MKRINKDINYRDFKATCSNYHIVDMGKLQYKHVSMFGDKTLIYWKESGKISTRSGHVIPKN